ncbi:hypothetical protein [Xanthomonas arboricola]|uniref:hypothetical protein n=1 Tax=Xanthomonas arboricola TaxID=56448 RepID=UPI001ADC2E04|nr:hypothetical protein [Xanthomonas arboricola]
MSVKQPPASYESRITVFLDLLGFKDHIDQSISDPHYPQKILRAFQTIYKHVADEGDLSGRQIAQFSDCVVVSYKENQSSAVFDLIITILLLQVELASQGFLVRGAVTVGPLFHDKSLVFGPALVEAYRLESSVAKHPRIIVDPKIVTIARNNPAPHHKADDEEHYVNALLKEDMDGNKFIEYVSWQAVVEQAGAGSEQWPGYMLELSKVLSKGLQSIDHRALEKIIWLYHEYLQAIDHFLVPQRPKKIIQAHQSFYNALAKLPRLQTEAKKAQRRIDEAQKASEEIKNIKGITVRIDFD